MKRHSYAQRIVKSVQRLFLNVAARRVRRLARNESKRPNTSTFTIEMLQNRLKRYEEQLELLRVENEDLRSSATTFGELAERLQKAVKSARGSGRGRTPIPGRG